MWVCMGKQNTNLFKFIAIWLMACCSVLLAEESSKVVSDSLQIQDSLTTVADTLQKDSSTETASSEEKTSKVGVIRWLAGLPLEYVVYPVFSGIVYPFSEPLKYAFDNGVIDKGIEIFTFGDEKNVMVYPTMNLKPGTSTMLGFTYRHSHLALDRDYLVVTSGLYANSDVDYVFRYNLKKMLDGNTFLAFVHSASFNRDGNFVLLGTNEAYFQADTMWRFEAKIGHPLPFPNTSLQYSTAIRIRHLDLPDRADDIIDDEFHARLAERGVYQDYNYFPQKLTFSYTGAESPFVPTSGINFYATLEYAHVTDYKHIPEGFDWLTSEKNHDYMSLELVFQRFMYFGSMGKSYQFTKSEARARRREYSSLFGGDILKIWDPNKITSWILDRRVLAMQIRYIRSWEMEEGGMPLTNYSKLNDQFPLRGYGDMWTSSSMLGVSWEYRWPVDYYVDGIAFTEYAVFADERGDWKIPDNFRNSWGFGVRVRTPDMYFFRLQLGFHGLHGIHFVMTISPEFQ